ncbi:hypothetical protein [Nocardioides sp.]|uniref:hypothetical protein n=1 Tax=Nocardioides sp. TaxID=35761 RepID=UPI00286B9BE3|nr:hypothetical protein [Nocardioides sp.]
MRAETTHPPTVTIEETVDEQTAQDYFGLYRETFGELATRAVARQVLHESEFMEEMRDPRVHKYVARLDDQIVGISTLTSDLETVPWISPDYFAHHYPEHTARRAVFYLGFTLVRAEHRRSRVFQAMIERVVELLVAERAVCAWDICAFNDDSLGFGAAIEHFLHSQAEVTVEKIDRQTYYAGTFAGPARSR